MFEDILKENRKDVELRKLLDESAKICPVCSSDEVGTYNSGSVLYLYCARCGYKWPYD